jgi:hypothetical protein
MCSRNHNEEDGRGDNDNDKDNDKDNLMGVPLNLLVEMLSYCDASDYITMIRASRSFFATPIRLNLCSTNSISFSFLLKNYPNSFTENQGQQIAVQILLKLLLPSHYSHSRPAIRPTRNYRLERLEFSNLRGTTGSSWLPELRNLSLVTIDFTNCIRLDSGLLLQYLNDCPTTLRHLHLNGCRSVGPDILDCIERCHGELLSLSLGSCSQTIHTSHMFQLLGNLNSLKHLDLHDLTHIKDKESADAEEYFVDKLPDSIESINLSGTKPLRLVCPEVYSTMNTYLNRSLEYMEAAQVRDQNVQNHLRALVDEDGPVGEIINLGDGMRDRGIQDSAPDVFIWRNEDTFRLKIKHLVLDGAGHPRTGIFRGSVATFSLGRCIREIHLSGCESVRDWEVHALALNCGKTLRCFQMRAGSIGNSALEALGKHCHVLGEVDVSACFEISDDGIIALCRDLRRRDNSISRENETEEIGKSSSSTNERRRILRSSLTVLKIASLPKITNCAIEAISRMESLIVLDIENCANVTPSVVHKTVQKLSFLVEINAKDISLGSPSLSVLLRNDPCVHRTLKFVNEQAFSIDGTSSKTAKAAATAMTIATPRPNDDLRSCCTVRTQSQRLTAAVPHGAMYHCIDCKLIPALDRGFCAECLRQCHKGHETFLGSYCTFSCDCPFLTDKMCQAIAPSTQNLRPQSQSNRIKTIIHTRT